MALRLVGGKGPSSNPPLVKFVFFNRESDKIAGLRMLVELVTGLMKYLAAVANPCKAREVKGRKRPRKKMRADVAEHPVICDGLGATV